MLEGGWLAKQCYHASLQAAARGRPPAPAGAWLPLSDGHLKFRSVCSPTGKRVRAQSERAPRSLLLYLGCRGGCRLHADRL